MCVYIFTCVFTRVCIYVYVYMYAHTGRGEPPVCAQHVLASEAGQRARTAPPSRRAEKRKNGGDVISPIDVCELYRHTQVFWTYVQKKGKTEVM